MTDALASRIGLGTDGAFEFWANEIKGSATTSAKTKIGTPHLAPNTLVGCRPIAFHRQAFKGLIAQCPPPLILAAPICNRQKAEPLTIHRSPVANHHRFGSAGTSFSRSKQFSPHSALCTQHFYSHPKSTFGTSMGSPFFSADSNAANVAARVLTASA